MPMDHTQARDEMLGLLEAAWQLDADSTNVVLLFEDDARPRPDSGAYAVAAVRFVDVPRVTLGGENGQKRYTSTGLVTVQIRTPQGDGYTLSDKLSRVARDAFRGNRSSGGAVFSRVRIKSEGADGTYMLTNVIVDFEYDEVA